jgi:hypothetical protein
MEGPTDNPQLALFFIARDGCRYSPSDILGPVDRFHGRPGRESLIVAVSDL